MKNPSTYPLRLPRSVKAEVERRAKQDGVSVNQFVATAVAEKLAALSTIEYLEKRAKRGSREKLLEILNKAPDVEPEESDKL